MKKALYISRISHDGHCGVEAAGSGHGGTEVQPQLNDPPAASNIYPTPAVDLRFCVFAYLHNWAFVHLRF